MQGVLNLTERNYTSTSFSEACIALSRNPPLPPEIGFNRSVLLIYVVFKKMQLKCVLFGDPGTLFYTEGAVLPPKKSPWGNWCFCHRGPTWRLFLRPLVTKALLGSSFNFPCLQRPCAFCYPGLLVKKIFVQTFHVHTPTPVCTCVCACLCVHSATGKERKTGLSWLQRRCWTVRTQPIQPENYRLTYESWILKVLIHLRMEILASPDLHIGTYMTSFSDRLFFFFPCLLKLAK